MGRLARRWTADNMGEVFCLYNYEVIIASREKISSIVSTINGSPAKRGWADAQRAERWWGRWWRLALTSRLALLSPLHHTDLSPSRAQGNTEQTGRGGWWDGKRQNFQVQVATLMHFHRSGGAGRVERRGGLGIEAASEQHVFWRCVGEAILERALGGEGYLDENSRCSSTSSSTTLGLFQIGQFFCYSSFTSLRHLT